ncbi:hypothetical protein GCM10027294_24040 [Marinactinospora endophytica]
MDLCEPLPRVFLIGSRAGYNGTGFAHRPGRYGALRDVSPSEEHARITWDGAAAIGDDPKTTVDHAWRLRRASHGRGSLHDPVAVGPGGDLHPVAGTELGLDVGQVPFDRSQ